ncbi:MAG: YitT family protein [Ruminococcaceae bacterium]|nr:YitT family protein [Oscillospiraceae bacterium]
MRHENRPARVTSIKDYIFIIIGSLLYACSTLLFIFPHSLLLGGTSGISVILESFLHFSPGSILTAINSFLIVLAFILLGKEMGIKTLIGSILTTALIGILEPILVFPTPVIKSPYLSAAIGSVIIAFASGIMFYVDSSSGGTDVIALIINKYTRFKIGKALLITDIAIVIIGGILSGTTIFFSSFLGLLIKTLGIDFVISLIKKRNHKTAMAPNEIST